jgi:hypothetical protein
MADQDDWAPVEDWTPVGGGPQALPPAGPGAEVRALPPVTAWSYPAMAGSALAKGLAVGLGVPGDVEALGVRGLRALGADVGRPGDLGLGDTSTTLFPTSQEMLDLTNRLGITNVTGLTPGFGPYPEAEKIIAGGVSGLGSAIPSLAVGRPPVVPSLVAGATGGAAGEAAHEFLPSVPLAAPAAGLVAGLGTQGVASALAGNTFRNVAGRLGSMGDLESAGDALQASAKNWLKVEMPAREAAAWAPVDAALVGKAQVPLAQFEQALQGINTRGGTLQPLVSVLGKALPAQLQKALQSKTQVGIGLPVPWEDARALRTSLGDAMRDPGTVRDIGEQNLAALYKAITGDLAGTAQAAGAGDAFARANAQSAYLHDFADGPLAGIVNSARRNDPSDPAPGRVASRLLNGGKYDGTELARLRAELPEAVDELASHHLANNPAGWGRLSAGAKAALVTDPRARARLDLTVPGRSNPVTTSAHALQTLAGGGFGGALGAIGEYLLGQPPSSLFGPAVGELAGLLAPSVYRGLAAVGHNPALLRVPATGALGGANALFPGPGAGPLQ